VTRPRRLSRFTVLAAAGAMALTGCGSVHPGAAAVVGHDTITEGQVDALAQGLCSANGASGQQLASREARQGALQVLLDTELSQQFGQKRGASPNQQQISQALARSSRTIAALPKDERPAFKDALVRYWEGQLMLMDIGRKSLEAQGKTHVTPAQATAEGNRLRQQYVKTISVSVNPSLGSFRRGTFQPATNNGSLSVPASESARQGNSANPDASWVASLPASQQCG